MAGNEVLLIGLDPNTVPGVDAALVEAAIAFGEVRLEQHGFLTTYCLVGPDAADEEFVTALARKPYDCVVVGGASASPSRSSGSSSASST